MCPPKAHFACKIFSYYNLTRRTRHRMAEGEFQYLRHLQLWKEEEVQADVMSLSKYPCPCMECAGGKVLDRATIRKHLRSNKRDHVFITSIFVSHSNNSLLNERERVALMWGSFHLFVHEFCRTDGDPL